MKVEQKKDIIKQLKENFKNAQSVVFVDFSGLGARDLDLLRSKIRESGGRFQVTKNTLIARALDKNANRKSQIAKLEGPTAIIFSSTEPLSPIKALVSFREEFEKPEIKGGLFEGNPIGAERVFELSEIPGKKELLAQLVASLNAPLQRLAFAASTPMKKFITIVDLLSSRE